MASINSDVKTMSHLRHNGASPASNTPDESPEAAAEARLAMMELANMISVPMALNAFVALNVPDALHHAAPDPLSAADLLRRLPGVSHTASPENLQRLLRLLASHRVVHEHFTDDGRPRRYSLTPIGRTLVSPEADSGGSGASYAAYVLQRHQEALLRVWPRLADTVLDADADPFKLAYGVYPYDYYGQNPDVNDLMQRAMTGMSIPVMEAVINGYSDGFRGVGKLVDVGGGAGTSLRKIMDRFPDVSEGVNFDLPEVVARAPTLPGVTHVGGDMFKWIPSGDAIFTKWVLTTWTDDEFLTIMKNCYNSLPKGGKLIACEPVVPETTDTSSRTRALLECDIYVMAIYRAKGKERTEEEFRQLGQSAGFSSFRAVYVDHFFTVLEFQK